MGRKHFSEEHIAYALRQSEAGTPVAERTTVGKDFGSVTWNAEFDMLTVGLRNPK